MIDEQFARLSLQAECADVVNKAKETAGAMIRMAAFERGDDLVGLFNTYFNWQHIRINKETIWINYLE